MTTPIASEPERLVDELMKLADACITLARGVAEAHALDEPAEEWELDQKLTAARAALRAALESALSSRSGSAAETAGWRLVPVEPTSEMISAGGQWGVFAGSVWRAMLAAAPQPAGNTEGKT